MWCVRLSDSQRNSLRELINEQEELGTALQAALEALDFARWDDLPDATLPWDRVSELARAQGIGEADVVWDLTAGIVTIEDIIEEVVGEIADETDPAVAGVRRLANGDWWVRGHVPITDLADYGLELPVDSDAFNSVGGFVFGELGRLPKRGDMVRTNGYSLRVESVRENRVEAVRIRDHGRPDGSERAEAGPPRRGSP